MQLVHRTILKGLLLAAAGLFLTTSCVGYRLGDVKPANMSGITSLAVPTFKNDTLEPRISSMLTTHVIQQLQRDGTYKIGTVSGSDAVLNATITDIERRPFRISRSNFLSSDQLKYVITIEYWVKDSATGEILSDGTVTGDAWGLAEENLQLSERQGLEGASERLALDLMSKISEGW